MDVFIVVIQFVIVMGAILIGARYGSIAIGMAGGAGVLLLGLTGAKVELATAAISKCTQVSDCKASYTFVVPFDVIAIIMAVIAAIAAVQVAGGLDWLVVATDRLLRKHPKQLMFLAPTVTYLMTLCAGTGHTAFAALPVITEVAKENNIKPAKPLALAVVSSQMAICASPISAAVVYMASQLEPRGVSYLQLLAVMTISTFVACLATAGIMALIDRKPLDSDPLFLQRLEQGLVKYSGAREYEPRKGDKASVAIFLTSLVVVMVYATLISDSVGLIKNPTVPRNEAIITIMLLAATLIVAFCKVDASKILNASVFKSGMSACVCILGVAWLGTTFVNAHLTQIKAVAGGVLKTNPWALALVFFFAAALLYSQAATTKALLPAALSLGVAPLTAVASFSAVSALFVLPTYPTLLAAVEMDDTGSTKIGKYVFNHSFIIPGTINIALAVLLGFGVGAILL